MQRCASCGIAGGDDIKLKRCTACYLVKYCSVICQREHRPKHKKECKKRAAELKDEILFKQPESTHHGDCPICCLPLPIDPEKSTLTICCCKMICFGCTYADSMREIEGGRLPKCPFCRKEAGSTDEENNRLLMKRIEANDPVAICYKGTTKFHEGDHKAAFEYWSRAAALGDVRAHYEVSVLYREGKGVEKDKKKELQHLEEAAIGGHPGARHNLGCVEEDNGRMDRAAKHWIIAAKLGDDYSLKSAESLYNAGLVSKEDFAAALRGHIDATAATKSRQRGKAAQFYKRNIVG